MKDTVEEGSPGNVGSGPSQPFREREQAWRHLDALYEIGKRLAAFEGEARTFPEVMALVSQAHALRSAVLFVGLDSGGDAVPERPSVKVWRAEGVPAARLTAATEQATSTYAWRVGMTVVEPQHELGESLEGVGSRAVPAPPRRAEPAFITLPLVAKGHTFGTLQVEPSGVLAEEGLAFLDAVAHQLALALDRHYALRREVRLRERAELFERVQRELLRRERLAHQAAEDAHRRQAFMAEASALLASSLDYRTSLPQLARLLVPAWADCCAMELLGPSGAERIAMVAVEPAGHRPEGASFVAQVLASHPWVALPANPEHLPEGHTPVERAEWSGFPSNLRLLIRVRGRTLGVMSLISARPERYGPVDITLFETLAQRIATAVDSALLFQQAQEAVRWREELLAVVSHDIKTPLLVVRMNAEMLLHAARPPGEERRRQGRRHLETILQAADQMRELIGGILDRARLQGMPMPLAPRPWRVDELFQQAARVLQPLALEKSQELVLEVCPGVSRVRADRERVLQVLSNLVGNAIKFTPASGTVTLRARKVDGMVRVSVKDNGPGIAPEDVPHLFERFWRASGVSERGTGLGLSIVKSIVEEHGGSLWVETQPGVGSTFFFTLPAAEP